MINKGWAWVLVGGFIEALWPCLMKAAGDMDDNLVTVLALFFSILATLALNFGLKYGLPIGASYAIWIGLGVAGTAFADLFIFDESMSSWAYLFMALIFAGVAGINISDDTKEEKTS